MFYVFSYGSNLLLERIRRRVYSVEKIANYTLADFELVFNKTSIDGSTKANVRPSTGSKVLGVIQRMPMEHKPVLDEYEGLGNGYHLGQFRWKDQEVVRDVHYYICDDPHHLTTGHPYIWYRDYVLYGAIENNFDPAYINRLRRKVANRDPNDTRRGFNDLVLDKYR
ncbi:MAG: gamma-glutamylcyclotransferase family protein [Bacteroidota bacterium]